jgi:hypothetical protein
VLHLTAPSLGDYARAWVKWPASLRNSLQEINADDSVPYCNLVR